MASGQLFFVDASALLDLPDASFNSFPTAPDADLSVARPRNSAAMPSSSLLDLHASCSPGSYRNSRREGLVRGIFVHQRTGLAARHGTLHLLDQDPTAQPQDGIAWGAPPLWRPRGAEDSRPVRLRDYWHRDGLDGTIDLEMPLPLPETIRVGRRFSGTCRDNPVQRVDEVPLEEYVEGVLLPEIGVFRSAETGRESAREVFKVFAEV